MEARPCSFERPIEMAALHLRGCDAQLNIPGCLPASAAVARPTIAVDGGKGGLRSLRTQVGRGSMR